MPPPLARERFAAARVARLATVGSDGAPHVVPITFAVLHSAGTGDRIVSAVDHKPKSTRALRRLDNIAAHPRVALLVDEYDEDWSRLWWVRADGVARVASGQIGPVVDVEPVEALQHKYDHYHDVPPAGPFVVVDVTRWSGWAAGGDANLG